MADLTATLEAGQWDLIGTLLAREQNQAQSTVNQVAPILASLKAQLQKKPVVVPSNGAPIPEVEADTSPMSPVP